MAAARRFDWLFRPRAPDEDAPLSAEARFAEALVDLPAVERSALALSEIGGLDRDEIAVRLGTEPVIVEKLLARARDTVRASMSAGGRALGALTPIQAWWQSGASSPAARAAGVAAVTVLGVGFAHDASSIAPRPALGSQDQVVPSRLVARTPAQAPAPARVVRAAPTVIAIRAPQRRAAAKPVATPVATRIAPRRWPVIRVQPRPSLTAAAVPAPQPAPPAVAAPAAETSASVVPVRSAPAPPPLPTPRPVEVPPPPVDVPPRPVEIQPPPLPALPVEPALPPVPALPAIG